MAAWSETLWVRAFDGTDWSTWDNWDNYTLISVWGGVSQCLAAQRNPRIRAATARRYQQANGPRTCFAVVHPTNRPTGNTAVVYRIEI